MNSTVRRAGFLPIAILVGGAAFPQITQAIPSAKLAASDGAPNDLYGSRVALSGNRALIGAWGPSTPAGSYAGAAYVAERQTDGSWLQVAKLTANDGATSDFFGFSVALDGDRALVGAMSQSAAGSAVGAAYVFERQPHGFWVQVAKLEEVGGAPLDQFGYAVALRGDRALIGTPTDQFTPGLYSGSMYIFERQPNGTWLQMAKCAPADAVGGDAFGFAVSLDADRALVGAYNKNSSGYLKTGAAYLFERQPNGSWLEASKLLASDGGYQDYFGCAVSLSGDRALIGAYHDDTTAGPEAGSSYVFERQPNGTWTQMAKIRPGEGVAGDHFGAFVSLVGERALIGAPLRTTSKGFEAGSAYLFERSASGLWDEVALIEAGDGTPIAIFGSSVALDAERALVGAQSADTTGGSKTGAAYVFRLCDHCVSPYGTGTPGCAGPHALNANLPPEVGMAAFALMCDKAPAASLGLAIVADAQDASGSDPFGLGVLLHVDLAAATLVLPLDITSDASGNATVACPIPNSPALAGQSFYGMALWAWSACPLPPFNLSSSAGLEFTILAP